MKIKNINVTIQEEVNPISRAIALATAEDNDTAVLFKFSIEENEEGEKYITAKPEPLNCRMHNILPGKYGKFASLVMKLYYHEMFVKYAKLEEEAKKAYSADEISLDEYQEVSEIFQCYRKIDLSVFEQGMNEKAPIFALICAEVFSGEWRASTSPNKFIAVLSDYVEKQVGSRDDVRNALNEYMKAFSEMQDTETVRKFWCKANATLTEQVIARYYKGRSIDKKSGKVRRRYDSKGSAVRREVVFAIIEMMQAKLRSSSFGFESDKDKQEEQKKAQEEQNRKAQDERNEREQERDNKEQEKKNDKAGKKSAKTLYREMCKKYHPDNTETGNAEIFKEIQTAYDNKDTAELRRLYNKYM